ncbi:putative stress-responsive nuclear envelope protein [Lyophyllum shimeji]|uniref:Stress-responsive nuclear envelope protein n=1 Tax=Lyophyllum shimeji TaxID=47721 RepID=A0A9P3UTG9_LYOSH|nr:putative stress-responsive nuclear envelope protein [Lyophyllum shimeji]
MRPSLLLLGLGLTATVQASSWFGSTQPPQPYQTWSVKQLKDWLRAHNIECHTTTPTHAQLRAMVEENWNTATSWTQDQYASAQKTFADIRDASFDKWDESRLREFLLDQGIVAPKGPKERLVQLAKTRYRAYQNAASSIAAQASDSAHHASESVSSIAAQATETAAQALDDTKDFVYSTWDNNRLRKYLESKGVQVKEGAAQSRNELLRLMRDAYAKVANPVYEAWSDSYLHNWLVARGTISPKPPSPYSREYLLQKMKDYYYDANDTVYHTWSDSQIRDWLVRHGIIKSDAQIAREKMLKLMRDNYLAARSTLFSAWSDSQIRNWLVKNGYIDDRSAAQMKRDELVKLISEKYYTTTAPPYLAWPDARLRAYLRQHGISEEKLPLTRPGLLQEVRILWVQAEPTSETLWERVKEIVGSVGEGAEERLSRIWSILRGKCYENEKYAEEKYQEGKARAMEEAEQAQRRAAEAMGQAGRRYNDAEKKYEEEKERVYEKGQEARERLGEAVKTRGQKIKGEL